MKWLPENIKQKKPVLFSKHFGIDPKRLTELGVFNPILNFDTRLFVDPVFLKHSAHETILECYDSAVNCDF